MEIVWEEAIPPLFGNEAVNDGFPRFRRALENFNEPVREGLRREHYRHPEKEF